MRDSAIAKLSFSTVNANYDIGVFADPILAVNNAKGLVKTNINVQNGF